MNRDIDRRRALLNAGFVLAVLSLGGFGMAQVASRQWRVQATFPVRADFTAIGGVEVGQRVRVQGMDAGVVEAVVAPAKPGARVRLVLRVDERLRSLVRSDARAKILSEGVVGAKVVEIIPGRSDAPPLDRAGVIQADTPIEIADLLEQAGVSLRRIDAVAIAAEQGLGEINQIATSIRKGEGSVGKLVQDEEAYRKLVGLSARGERTLNDIEENLAALKRTWPLSRYFNDRSFFDRDRVLFHPGADRESQTLPEKALFEPGRSVLTDDGRHKLDEIGEWFKKVRRPTTEVVIAAFTDGGLDQNLAEALTQEQAESVRKYLVSRFSIASVGWFSTRKVAAVGFGSQPPRTQGEGDRDQPPRRVEIILFTPHT